MDYARGFLLKYKNQCAAASGTTIECTEFWRKNTKYEHVADMKSPGNYTEMGAWTREKELRTPPLSGLILPGVTRQSVLEITRSWNEFKVVEKDITMSMLLNALKENRLHHMFGSGTACVVSPVMELYYKNNRYSIPFTEDPSSIPERILKEYTDIQLSEIDGCHDSLKKSSKGFEK
ncbi:hypothetical protein X801_01646 [Opisthorchis viverrini]|uniref:Aminotransferase class IV n=1 Tax=Opisthorchis viverrini TaxID=6198 RepID=A0A1S8X7P1_OPIVI|nr:hypothetical protein X801_01646 [Opisthorchis viverrini]